MPLAFIILGALIIVTAYKGTYQEFGNQLVKDFTGGAGSSFIYWVAAVAIIGLLGYVKAFRTPSRALLTLIVLAFFLSNRGVFSSFQNALGNVQPAKGIQEPSFSGALPITITNSGGAGSKASDAIGSVGGILGGITKLFGGAATGTGGLL